MQLDPARLDQLLDDFAKHRLLVVGDLVVDEYVSGDVVRVSPEAPVPVVAVRDETLALGGAGNVARNIAALGGEVSCCAVVGADPAGRCAVDLFAELGLDPGGLVVDEGRPTTRKTRVVARNQQMVRFDRETLEPPGTASRQVLREAIERVLPDVTGVVAADYGKGVLAPDFAAEAMECFRRRNIPVFVDPKALLAPWSGASLVKPNLGEAECLAGMTIADARDLGRAAGVLREELGGADVVVTRGGEGMTLFEGDAGGLDVPTVARAVFDV
ncbi:MAG: PfkB family carbohydrate kinase, partial [Myxococcota bacterium]|nr:PfkB family carbohydrate kinase [Myxococcota bacterium]